MSHSDPPASPYPFDAAAYVDQMSAFLQLPIPPELRENVIENIQQIWQIAQPVMTMSLPDDLEAGPVFEP
jgi:Protein of unknown function (DUF4089)